MIWRKTNDVTWLAESKQIWRHVKVISTQHYRLRRRPRLTALHVATCGKTWIMGTLLSVKTAASYCRIWGDVGNSVGRSRTSSFHCYCF